MEEEEPTPGKDPAETAGCTKAMDPDPDPDSRATEAATGGGATEPLEARTGAVAGPGDSGERPEVETPSSLFLKKKKIIVLSSFQ